MNDQSATLLHHDVGAHTPLGVLVTHAEQQEESSRHVLRQPFGLIGRSPNCDIRLKGQEVSFRHAYLQVIGGRLLCADLASRSGTHWEDGPQRSGWLTSDCQMRIGSHTLQLTENKLMGTGDEPTVPTTFDPLAVYDGQMGDLPQVRMEFLNAPENDDWHVKRMLTFAGSARGCKLRFEGERVSRVHASLLLTPGGLWVIDLLGRGGTKLNGTLIRNERLEDGDILKIGQFQMRVRYGSSFGVKPPSTNQTQSDRQHDQKLNNDSSFGDVSTTDHATTDTRPVVPAHEPTEIETPVSTRELIDKVVINRLLTREQIDRVLDEIGEHSPTFDVLSEALIERGMLSTWQVDQLATQSSVPLVLDYRYKLIERLGYGSMGVVFRAFDEALQCEVAVKIPHASMIRTERMLKRFRRETLLSANLVHPHIVRTLNIGRQNSFAVLELVNGDDLRELIDQTGIPSPAVAVDYIIQVAEAVAFAGQRGVVHRDIKPSNILIDRDGTAKLFDFGLAHLDERARDLAISGLGIEEIQTRAGFAVGTVQYMSPEQRDESDSVDTRSDIYSLGCTLYELLSGSPPFDGDSQHAILQLHANEPLPPIEGLNPELAEILERSLAKNLTDRYQTPMELIKDLTNWLVSEDSQSSLTEETDASLEIARAQEILQEELEKQQQQLGIQREEFSRREDQLRRDEADISAKGETLQAEQKQFEHDREQLELDRQSLRTAQDELEGKTTALSEERGALAASLATLNQQKIELDERREQLAFQSEELDKREEVARASQEQHQQATLDLERTREELKQLQIQLDARQEQSRNMEERLAQERDTLAASNAELNEASANLEREQAQLRDQQQAAINLQTKLEVDQSALAADRADLEQERRKHREEQEHHRLNCAELEQQRAEAEAARAELDRLTEELSRERQAHLAECERLTEKRTTLAAEARRLKETLGKWLEDS